MQGSINFQAPNFGEATAFNYNQVQQVVGLTTNGARNDDNLFGYTSYMSMLTAPSSPVYEPSMFTNWYDNVGANSSSGLSVPAPQMAVAQGGYSLQQPCYNQLIAPVNNSPQWMNVQVNQIPYETPNLGFTTIDNSHIVLPNGNYGLISASLEHRLMPVPASLEHRLIKVPTPFEHRLVKMPTSFEQSLMPASLENRLMPPTSLEHRLMPNSLEHRLMPPASLEHRLMPPASLEHRLMPDSLEQRLMPPVSLESFLMIMRRCARSREPRRGGLDEDTIEGNLMSWEYEGEPGVDPTCSICHVDYEVGETEMGITDCAHDFHYDCIMEWLKLNNSCPLCREPALTWVGTDEAM